MGIFDVFKKGKKAKTLELPPPPMAPETEMQGFEKELPSLPEMPKPPVKEKPLPSPKIEELPVPLPPPAEKQDLEFPEIPEVPHEEPAPTPEPREELEIPSITLPEEEKEQLPPRYESPFSEEILPPPTQMVKEEKPLFKAMLREEPLKQMFISIDDFHAILNGLNEAKKTLTQSETLVEELNKIKNKEDKIFEDWKGQIEDIERKLSYLDQAIYKGEQA